MTRPALEQCCLLDLYENLSLPLFAAGETAVSGQLPLLGGGRLGGCGLLFLLFVAGGQGLFLRGFLLIRFRGFVAHNVTLFRELTLLRHVSFSAGRGTLPAGPMIVNDGRRIHRVKGGISELGACVNTGAVGPRLAQKGQKDY